MTLHASDLFLVVAVVAAGSGASYLLLLRRLRMLLTERQLKIAEELGALNDAIQTLETRLAGHIPGVPSIGFPLVETSAERGQIRDSSIEEPEGTAPEIKAAIAAAAVAALGPDAQVKSIKPAAQGTASPWTQQGRVLVQGSHNLRARR